MRSWITRLSCRGLRDVVDANMQDVRLKIGAHIKDKENWKSGKLPSLARWPRCTSLTLSYCVAYDLSAADAASLFVLPLAGMPLEARQRITRLTIEETDVVVPDVDVDPEESDEDVICSTIPDSEAVVALLAHRLPGLRELDIRNMFSMPCKRLHKQVMYDALASLPHLETLKLPGCRALACIATLTAEGGSSPLKYLEIGDGNGGDAGTLDAVMLDLFASLGSLQELHLHCCNLGEGPDEDGVECWALEVLLRSLPRSLQLLRLEHCWLPIEQETSPGPVTVNAEIRLEEGRVRSVELNPRWGSTPLVDLAANANRGLLPCLLEWQEELRMQMQMQVQRQGGSHQEQGGPQRQVLQEQQQEEDVQKEEKEEEEEEEAESEEPLLQLERLATDRIRLRNRDPLLTEEQEDRLRALLRRFKWVEVKSLRVCSKTPAQALHQAIRLLGSPKRLEVEVSERWANEAGAERVTIFEVGIELASSSGSASHMHASGHLPLQPPPQQQQQAPSLPSAQELVQAALARLTAGKINTATDDASTIQALASRGRCRALVLKGPSIALLTHGSDLLKSFLQRLQARAVAITGSDGFCISEAETLPSAGAVLVRCHDGRATAAVAQAATSLGEAAEGSALQVVPAPEEAPCWHSGMFRRALRKVVQEVWDAAAPEPCEAGGSITGQRRLDWLLGLREELVLPQAVYV